MSEPPIHKAKPKRKWRKRMLWLFAVLCVLAWALNGPIAKWGIAKALNLALTQQGMTGSTEVEGSLLSGFTLHDFSYQGEMGLQQITFSEASVSYHNLIELAKGKIGNVSLKSAVVVIDLDKFPAAPEDQPRKPIQETLATIQHWAKQPDISLSDVDVTLLKSSQPFAQFQFSEFSHAAGSEQFSLQDFVAHDDAGNVTPEQNVTLTWTPSVIDFQQLEVQPGIALQATRLDWTSDLQGSTQFRALGATFQIDVTDKIEVSLASGEIDMQKVNQRFQLDLPVSATISTLHLTVDDWKKPVQDWDITLEATAPTISYQTETLQQTQLRFTQSQQQYSLDISSAIENAPIAIQLNGEWSDPTSEQWWSSTSASYQVQFSNFDSLPARFFAVPKDLNAAEASATAQGEITISELELSSLSTDITLDGLTLKDTLLPKLSAAIDYQHLISADLKFSATQPDDTPIALDLHYHFEDDSYLASLQIKEEQPDWVNSLLKAFAIDLELKNTVDIEWNGTGTSDLQIDQIGSLSINKLTVSTSAVRDCDIVTEATYQWPDSVSVASLSLQDPRFSASCQLDWADSNLTIRDGLLSEEGVEIANFRAQLPLHLGIDSTQKFFNQQEPWALSLHSSQLSIPQLAKWLSLEDNPQLSDLEGAASLSIEVAGSPHAPHINGVTRLENLRGIANQDLDALHMLGSFATADDHLYFSGELLEAQTQRATLSLDLPFTPKVWLDSEETAAELIKQAAIAGSLEINQLPINRVSRFAKQLKEVDGQLTGTALVSGTLGDPQLALDTQIKIPKLVVAGSELDDIRNIEINCKIDSDRQIKADLKASINGGKFTSNATADLSDLKEPIFVVDFKTNHAMVYRDDSISVRANADLRLKGTLDDATISGKIGLVESLFYKDIDILPIGVPSSAVADVELPSLNTSKLTPNIPAPFGNWKLDVTLSMQDPLLIRGNLAGGQIEGKVQASGTLNAPRLDGSIVANKVVARLPFSVLKIDKGFAHFTPQNGLIPTLDIQGKSTIGNYDTSLYVYGKATSPKTSFTSSPPLPSNDIMTLLATGVTTSGLSNNTEVATLRALQLFLIKIKNESGDSKGTQILEKILGSIQEFEFNINETDHFTGRKFSSAKARINKRLYFTAQIDGQKQTRGLLVFVIKSR